MSPISLFWLLYIFYLASTLWDFYLSWRQYNVCRATSTRPAVVNEVISEEEFQKARNYKLDKMRFGFFSFAFDKAVMMAVIFCDILPWIWELCGHLAISIWPGSGEIFQSIIFIFFSTIFERVTSLPFSYYDTFYIEQKHGFNKETVPFFFKDRVKKLVVEMAISVPIVAAIIWIVLHSGLAHFHVVIWAFISLIIFVMMFVYPEFIAPLFDKYTPLPTSELKTKIEQLASKVSFPLTKIYVVEGSKRSSHSNAYMYGFWKNKRIVIYDTLLSKEMNEQLKQMSEQQTKEKESKSNATKEEPNKEEEEKKSEPEEDSQPKSEGPKQLGMSDDEVVAVLGHELGHWKYLHSVCLLISTELNLLLMLAVFAHFYRNESLFAAFGFSSQPVIIGLVLVTQYILGPYNELLSVAMSFVSRRFEFAADNFAAGLGYARLLQTGLIKLGKDNLSFPVDDWLYSACNHSHPPIVERVEALKKYQ